MTENGQVEELEYVGFWLRTAATLIDTLLLMVVITPLLVLFYGVDYFFLPGAVKGTADFVISWILPAIVVLVFWMVSGATPGKMAMSARIVDSVTGEPLSFPQSVVRYLGYIVSTIPFFVGFIWAAFDARKQSWHDKLAGTVVVRPKGGSVKSVRFDLPADSRQEPRI
jgi:uncharacterized RDD family membrane protein YckC